MMRDFGDTIQQVKRTVDAGLTYRTDEKTVGKVEHWQSHAEAIRNDPSYRAYDDCDGFALSYAEMAAFFGIPKELIRICYVEIEGYGGHLCCAIYNPENGHTLVLDNNEPYPVKWESLRSYRWISYMMLSEPGEWVAFPK